MIPFLKPITDRADKIRQKFGVRINPWPLLLVGLLLLVGTFVLMPNIVSIGASIAFFMAPIWLPILIVSAAWESWIILKRSEFIAKQKHILLEIKPPRTVTKTPLAMEAVLSGLHHGPGEGNWYNRSIKGQVRPWWSLEIASLGGEVHFFIWTRAGFRRIIEAQLYAQYPGVQVSEASDYTRLISAKTAEWSIWGCDFKKSKDDPLPIKTYVDYGLDKVQKEPEQTDPLANLIEFMGSMGKSEQLWLQFVIRTHKGEKYNKKKDDGKAYKWHDKAKEMINKIREETRDLYVDPVTKEKKLGFPNPTKGQLDTINAIERNIAKLPFDVGVRGVYLAKDGKFDSIVISGLTGIFKQFSSEGWNGFDPTGWLTSFEGYPWEIWGNKVQNEAREGLIEAYRRRQFYHEPVKDDTMIMSTEELATVFHIPSHAIETPGLGRIQSATSEAPPNLPI